jgi:hypothetical protein
VPYRSIKSSGPDLRIHKRFFSHLFEVDKLGYNLVTASSILIVLPYPRLPQMPHSVAVLLHMLRHKLA